MAVLYQPRVRIENHDSEDYVVITKQVTSKVTGKKTMQDFNVILDLIRVKDTIICTFSYTLSDSYEPYADLNSKNAKTMIQSLLDTLQGAFKLDSFDPNDDHLEYILKSAVKQLENTHVNGVQPYCRYFSVIRQIAKICVAYSEGDMLAERFTYECGDVFEDACSDMLYSFLFSFLTR